MDSLPGRPEQPVALGTAALRADFQARLDALHQAAREWGVRPDHPEGIFVGTMIGTQAGFVEVALQLGEALDAVVRKAHATAEEELARQRVVTQQTRMMLDRASTVIRAFEEESQTVVKKVEADKDAAIEGFVKSIIPQMVRGVRESLVIRERRHNAFVAWRQTVGIGFLMIGLVVGGYVWASWSDWGSASRMERIGAAIERCQLTSRWTDDHGEKLCRMRDFSSI